MTQNTYRKGNNQLQAMGTLAAGESEEKTGLISFGHVGDGAVWCLSRLRFIQGLLWKNPAMYQRFGMHPKNVCCCTQKSRTAKIDIVLTMRLACVMLPLLFQS